MSEIDRIAEVGRIVASACNAHVADENGFTGWSRSTLVALAQVHATVALAEAQEKAAIAGAQHLIDALPYYEGDLSVRVHGTVGTR